MKMNNISDMQVSLGAFQSSVDRALKTWSKNGNTARLWRGDATLWSGADEADWLGWLTIASQMRDQVGDLCAFAQRVREQGITDILLLGMGGSSLCPEVLAMTFGHRENWPRLHVLDSTVPAQVQRFADAVNLETTLCVVASQVWYDNRTPRILRVLLGKDARDRWRCGGSALCRHYRSGF